ncbi:MAG: type II toxin-antitoxin system VapC family toxin [Thermoanaerobaculia bacterium]|nr:type II toxin-antitoxin system VapC family toxin [Thermoanaerobaculia bacterium]
MKIYLDTCSLQRPLDVKSQPRIALEAEAVLAIIELYEAGLLDLVSSRVLLFETQRNRHPWRREYALDVLAKAKSHVEIDQQVKEKARELESHGIAPLDALHLASAIAAGCDWFCTCDDKLLRRASGIETGVTKVASPLTLITEIDT